MHYPDYKFTGTISRVSPNPTLLHTSVVGDKFLDPESAKAELQSDIQTLVESHDLPASSSQEQVEYQFVSGSAFSANWQTMLWEYNEVMVPKNLGV